jgi:hypothetical protein
MQAALYERRRPAMLSHAPHFPRPVEECIDGRVVQHDLEEFFLARESQPFGRPYGKLRISVINGCV